MKFHAIDLPNVKYTQPYNIYKNVILLALTLIVLTSIPLYLNKSSTTAPLPSQTPSSSTTNTSSTSAGLESIEEKEDGKCHIFSGNWVPYPDGPAYYTNETCNLIIPNQNCMKLGRSDSEFMKWRWKPDGCELPLFDAAEFLEIFRGKSLAFIGDSVGRNQMQSLLCILANVTYPEDLSDQYSNNTDYFKHYVYTDYNFTMVVLWAPYLVKYSDADPNVHSADSLMKLDLDEPDEAWISQVENFDYVIFSAGQWFLRPLLFYENNVSIGCHWCNRDNMTIMPESYGYRKAFRTVFRTLQSLENYKGVTFLRTFSPAHFENGDWNAGGSCGRTKPFSKEEIKLEYYALDMYMAQTEEFKAAQIQAKQKGLDFRLMDTTRAMLLRPDGHPNFYGASAHRNTTYADCVHWCLPGPIDTWNEFLLHMLKIEQGST
ncbi:protein trichome birefringence-like 19 [Argentina anserina]|uniref:protein trichome birefringence-like 19 n=1 Tax=Argentina anserina TaxID=57926 RepID=UPI0021762058|nr:protein trichome birefringence-like 19 [Potentilla anserina]